MIRAMNPIVITLLVCLLFASAGCEDRKQRIAMLEESNQQLLDDLQAAREELVTCRQSNEACQGDIAAARGRIGELSNQLAAKSQAPPGWTAVPGGGMIAIPGSVLFDDGDAGLRKGDKRSLEQIVSTLRSDYAAKDVLVIGHTDDSRINKSGYKDNYQLSTERALTVVRWLQAQGINAERLVAGGCGEHRPRVANSSPENKERNRRVEIFALDMAVRTASAR